MEPNTYFTTFITPKPKPNLNKPIKWVRKTLTQALVVALHHPGEDMGETGCNHWDAPEEGEWERVLRMRKEGHRLILGKQALTIEQCYEKRGSQAKYKATPERKDGTLNGRRLN